MHVLECRHDAGRRLLSSRLLILRGVIGFVALARRTFPRRCQPQLLVPTRRFHEVSGARRRSVTKLRKLNVGLSANHDPM